LKARVHVGTSGWTYADWRGRFYPKGVPQRLWLEYYATHFSTVELNATTYRLPQRRAIDHWLSAVPKDFRFTVKLSRLITHRRNLGEPRRFIDNYFRALTPLEPKVATILAQFPPYLVRDDGRLDLFLSLLPSTYRYAVEFREPSWYVEETYRTLRRHSAALCIHDMRGSETPDILTTSFAYIRFHGPYKAYTGSYSKRRLANWCNRIRNLNTDETWIYFNNDWNANAIRNAGTLREMLVNEGFVA
jgi:uncharacterized protein YecE (DUF72 family)